MEISYYNGVTDTKSKAILEFEAYLEGIRSGIWQDEVIRYRRQPTDKAKKMLHAVTPAGVFEKRNSSDIIKTSGFINIDVDQKDNPEINLLEARAELYADAYLYAGHTSVSGNSLSLYFKINPSRHYDSFRAIEKHLFQNYSIIVDQAAKDVSRLRFVSYDPELHLNKKAKKWTDYLPREKQEPQRYDIEWISTQDDFDFVLDQIKSGHVNLAEHYDDWIKIGFSIFSEFGESGRSVFHIISSMSHKYNRETVNEKYDLISKANTMVTIKTFFWYAKNAGLQIRSPRTKKIVEIAQIRKKQIGKSGGFDTQIEASEAAKKYLKENELIEGVEVDKVVNEIINSKSDDKQVKSDLQQRIKTIVQVVIDRKIRYNLVTSKLEQNSLPMSDNDLNSLYLDCIEIDQTIKRELFNSVVFSNRIESYNPFHEFFEKHKHLKPSGLIDKLLDTIKDDMRIDGEPFKNYKQIFLRKWLLSMIASVYGTYSLMIAVLTGKQMTEKSNWFRWLLPDELRPYYAESKLDAGKDDEILMTTNWLINDDEFGGKSKQEAKKLKDLSSKQTFSIRRPYGRVHEDITRIAVLCGTSNDDEVLNDPTGNRRIIPIKVLSIDIESYKKIDKTELFIELYHEWEKIGDGWMLTPAEVEMLNKATSKHEQTVIEFDLILKNYEADNSYSYQVSSTDVKTYLETKTGQRLSVYKIGQSLTKLGFIKKTMRMNNSTLHCWNVRPIDQLGKLTDNLPADAPF